MILKIISSVEIVYEGEVTSVTLPGAKGAFTVLKDHASLVSTLVKGKLTYQPAQDAQPQTVEVSGGLADIDKNIISVCIY